MRVYVVNCSTSVYNLGCAKLANYHRRLGCEVVEDPVDWFSHGDLALFSAIFTKDLEPMVQQVKLAQHLGMDVRIGGPAVTMLSKWVERETGVKPHIGLIPEMEKEPGEYKWTFTSRGCPRNCPFCLVTQLEGAQVVEDNDFRPAPNIGDNNILMTTRIHQELVVRRSLEAGFSSVDINSGFDCRVFEQDPDDFYHFWNRLPLAMWRFAFDQAEEEQPIRRTFEYLRRKGLDRHKVQAYVLSNFPGTTPEEVRYRAEVIKGYGMMPYLMVFRPVNKVKNNYIAEGWDPRTITRMTGYYNQPQVWMKCTWEEYNGLALKDQPSLEFSWT